MTTNFSSFRFDRKTFLKSDQPNGLYQKYEDRRYLESLRSQGSRRFNNYVWSLYDKPEYPLNRLYATGKISSRALEFTFAGDEDARGVFVDLGCGRSPDVLIAAELGFKAYGVDLFDVKLPDAWREDPRLKECYARWRKHFIRADIAEGLPFRDGFATHVSSHAAIDLIETNQRDKFWSEAYRILQHRGYMGFMGLPLTRGYGFRLKDEIARARNTGFLIEREVIGNDFFIACKE